MCQFCDVYPQLMSAWRRAHEDSCDPLATDERLIEVMTDARAIQCEVDVLELPQPGTVAGRIMQWADAPVAALPEGTLWWLEDGGVAALCVESPDGVSIPYAHKVLG